MKSILTKLSVLALILSLGCAAEPASSGVNQQATVARPIVGDGLVDVLRGAMREVLKQTGGDPSKAEAATYRKATTLDFELWAKDNCVGLPVYDKSLSSESSLRAVFVRGEDLGLVVKEIAAFDGANEGTLGDFGFFTGGLCDCQAAGACPSGCACVTCPSSQTRQACVPLPHSSERCSC